MRLPFQKKPLQISCKLGKGVFVTPGTLTLTKRSLTFEPANQVDIDAGVGAVNILLKDITSTLLGMYQLKLTISTKLQDMTFTGSAMPSFQRQLKTVQPQMRATRVKDKRGSFRLDLAGRFDATIGMAQLDNSSIGAKVVDLSTTGCSILTNADLRVGDYLNVGVTLDASAKTTTVFGRCVRLNRANTTQNMVGVQFISVRSATSRELNSFIMRRQRDRGSTTEAA